MTLQNKKLLTERKEAKRKLPDSLRQKMAQATAGTKPSMIPAEMRKGHVPGTLSSSQGTVTVTKFPKETKPEIDTLIAEEDDLTTLRQLINQEAHLNSQKKDIEKQLEPIRTRIKPFLDTYGINAAMCDGNTVSYSPSSQSSIDGTLLLASGVSLEVIQRCTKTTYSTRLVITPPKP